MNVPDHIYKRLNERKLSFSEIFLLALAQECERDTAILLKNLHECKNESSLPHKLRRESNGELVILIIRESKPITIMFRRSDQPFTPEALRVDEIKIWKQKRGKMKGIPKYDQCDSAVIQGVYCHERGCPNWDKIWDEESEMWLDPIPDDEMDFYDYWDEYDFPDGY